MNGKGMFINASFTPIGGYQRPTGINAEIEEYRYKMNVAKRDGNIYAYRDAKKHYDKLLKMKKRNA